MNKQNLRLIGNVLMGTGIGLTFISVLAYGEMRYYDGRISKYEELKPLLNVQYDMICKLVDKEKKEEGAN